MSEEPQFAPFLVGTRLRRVCPQGTKSGTDVDGQMIWFDRDGNTATVVSTEGRPHYYHDSEQGKIAIHAWSTAQFDDDPKGFFLRAIDVDDRNKWEVIQSTEVVV